MTDDEKKLIEKLARTTGAAVNMGVALGYLLLHDPHHREHKPLIVDLIARGLGHMDDTLEVITKLGGDVTTLQKCRSDMYDAMVGEERKN